MKNIFRFLMAVAVLFTASCAKEDISSSIAGGEVEVTFTANLPELGTRAYGEGKLAKELTVKVFESTTNEALTALDRTVTSNTGVFTFQLVLLKGMKYDIVLWAQDPNCGYYELNGKVVTMNYTGVNANDESRDAFYYYVQGFDPAVDTPSFALTRPFAQLNAAVNQSDMTAVSNSKVELTTSTVKVKTYTTLNIATGEVGGETEVEFVPTAMPKETFNTDYTLLSMNYILVPQTANGKMLSNVEFTFNATKNGSETAFTGTSYQDVPLKRNYRTNILGSLLTKPTDFEVKIEADFFEPDQKPEELFMAAVLGGEVTLTEDVVLTQPLKVESKMTINLNGKTISNVGGYAIENYGELTISGDGNFEGLGGIRSHAGKLTINGGNYTCSSNWSTGTYNHILKAENSEVVINGGTFDATIGGTNNAMINVSENSVVTINGGTFKNVNGTIPQFAPYMFTYEKNGKLIINDGDFYGGWRFNGETTTTDIYGGKFTVSYDGQSFHATSTHVVTIYGGVFSLENGGKLNPANHLAAGYKAVLIDSWYRVLPEVIADAAVAANVTAVTESTADVATALTTDNGEATMFMWNDVAYIAKYGEVIITSAADEATTVRGVVEYAASLTRATVAEGVEVVGNRTFRQCANLETVVLPNTLTEIGPAVFQSCSKLANVTIPASVTTIGEGAFKECSSLESINIPDGVTRIESECLRASGLEEVEFHAGVTYFGAQAFRDCKQLKKVIINAPEFTIVPNAFGVMSGALPGTVIYVANAEMKAYLESTLAYKNQFTIVVHNSVSTADELKAALAQGGVVELNNDITLSEQLTLPAGITLNGNGKQINGTLVAGGDVTFEGHTKVTLFYAAYNNRTTTIGEGACLEMTGTDRTTLGGTVFNITGTIADAKTADKTSIQPSLIIPGGISINGANDAVFNIKNAYVQIGSTSSKNSAANGTFTINIENSIAEFTNQLTFAEPTNGMNPTFNLNVKNSVLTTGTKLCIAAPNCNMEVDNSTVTLGSYLRNSGTLKLKNDSVLTGATIQFGENGGNNGAITVDNSRFTITGTSTGNPYDGRGTGSITAKNDATVTVDYYKDMTITVDTTSTFTGNKVQ